MQERRLTGLPAHREVCGSAPGPTIDSGLAGVELSRQAQVPRLAGPQSAGRFLAGREVTDRRHVNDCANASELCYRLSGLPVSRVRSTL